MLWWPFKRKPVWMRTQQRAFQPVRIDVRLMLSEDTWHVLATVESESCWSEVMLPLDLATQFGEQLIDKAQKARVLKG